jgi:alpha-D-ribose 1-methylphosphonate 5-triphosphate synthase subunit PhnG
MSSASLGFGEASEQPTRQARQEWMGVLARASASELAVACAGLPDLPSYRLLRRPEVGLVMVRARAGGTGDRFNLGEMSMTRCAVETEDGWVGLSYRAGRDVEAAERAALLDALLQDPARREALTAHIVGPLRDAQERARKVRRARVAATKVDFFTLVRGD